MVTGIRNSFAALLLFISASVPIMATAADEACAGVSQKCTKDQTYDKTIDGTVYSCYECKQALCKDGGNGGISGTATSSVCTAKATTFRPISLDDQSRGSDAMAPRPVLPRRPGRAVDPRPVQFDEADALFSKRLDGADAEQRGQPGKRTESTQTAPEHRKQSDRNNPIVEIVDGTRKSRTEPNFLRDGKPVVAPADPNLLPTPAPAGPTPIPYPNQP